jgi:hypothetical protein
MRPRTVKDVDVDVDVDVDEVAGAAGWLVPATVALSAPELAVTFRWAASRLADTLTEDPLELAATARALVQASTQSDRSAATTPPRGRGLVGESTCTAADCGMLARHRTGRSAPVPAGEHGW